MARKVVVIGGGIGGLTAAHELIERGFDVTVFERRLQFGGKAASITTEHGFSGEHGFRFFPGWYRHLPDTMERIPYVRGHVVNNLVEAKENQFLSYDRDPVVASLRFPKSFEDIATLAAIPENVLKLGLTGPDFMFFFGKLAFFAALPEAQRLARFESQTWWDFMEAEKQSDRFRAYLVEGVTRNTIAANPRQANAYTICTLVLRTLMDTVSLGSSVDRVLNGPTSKVWIEPWVNHLQAQKVQLFTDSELESLEFDADLPRIKGVKIRRHQLRVRCWESRWRLLTAEQHRRREIQRAASPADAAPPPRPGAQAFENEKGDELAAHWALHIYGRDKFESSPAARVSDLESRLLWSRAEELHALSDADLDSLRSDVRVELEYAAGIAERESRLIEADYFVFALPIEQMAYYVNRSPTLQRHDSSLKDLLVLSGHVEWMAGIQFYLTTKLEITPGHIDCVDSEWALTALCQTQFWTEEDLKDQGHGPLKGAVKTILSVDISAWNAKGTKFQKEAFACTREEIAEEVWQQLKDSVNRKNLAPRLLDRDLLGYSAKSARQGRVVPDQAFHLDDEIVDRFDRKKQGFYKQFESVQFSSEAVAARMAQPNSDASAMFAHGHRLYVNTEPLFVNRPNTWQLRPAPRTEIKNMFLAADYVQTNTNLATMEAANEAARTAVNELLLIDGSGAKPCKTWTLQPSVDAALSLARFLGLDVSRPGNSTTASGQVIAQAAAQVAKISGSFARGFEQLFRRK